MHSFGLLAGTEFIAYFSKRTFTAVQGGFLSSFFVCLFLFAAALSVRFLVYRVIVLVKILDVFHFHEIAVENVDGYRIAEIVVSGVAVGLVFVSVTETEEIVEQSAE